MDGAQKLSGKGTVGPGAGRFSQLSQVFLKIVSGVDYLFPVNGDDIA